MKKKTLIVISCSNSKKSGGDRSLLWRKNKSVISRLSSESGEKLLECRYTLSKRFPKVNGKDLGSNNNAPVLFMPAFERYDGNLYRQIDKSCWLKLSRVDHVEVLIVSALYGLLLPWEPIRKYNLPMGRLFASRLKLSRWWVNRGLDCILRAYIAENAFTSVYSFLGGSYSAIGKPLSSLRPAIKIHYKKYPGLGFGSDYYRGKDVNNLLSRLLG